MLLMGTLKAAVTDKLYIVWSGSLIAIAGIALIAGALTGGDDAAANVVASPTAVPATPTATPRPLSDAQVLIDTRRVLDLNALAGALEEYRTQEGAYPSTENNLMTVCASAFDPGCLLLTIDPDLSADDGYEPYWYRSDGASYVLFAQIERADPDHPCPEELPAALRTGDVYCIQSEGAE